MLASKLKALKVDLKRWNEEVVGHVEEEEEDPYGRAMRF
jgi:hypothetical protein